MAEVHVPTAEVHVPNANVPPCDAVGLLDVDFNDGTGGWASGCLVGPHHVVTCAHAIVKQGHGKPFASAARFYARWNQAAAPQPEDGVAAVNAFFPSWYRDGQDAWDIGVYLLGHAAPAPVQYFVPQASDTAALVGEDVTLTGYPANHHFEMWTDVDEVNGVALQVNQMLFTNDTDNGSSGSPVYQYDALEDIVRLWGVHNSVNPQYQLRSGLLITTTVYNWLQRALAEDVDPDHFTIGLDPAPEGARQPL